MSAFFWYPPLRAPSPIPHYTPVTEGELFRTSSIFTVDDQENLVRVQTSKDEPMSTFPDHKGLVSTLAPERLRGRYVEWHEIHAVMSAEDQLLTQQQWKAKSRYGLFPIHHRFGGLRDTAYWDRNAVTTWLRARYSEVRPDLVTAAERAGFVFDDTASVMTHPRPRKRRPTTDNGKRTPRTKLCRPHPCRNEGPATDS